MYKKATKFWNRERRDTGGESKIVREGRKAAKRYLDEEVVICRVCKISIKSYKIPEHSARGHKYTHCEYCNFRIRRVLLPDHLFANHELAICKFCKKYISRSDLHNHIKQIHGENIYQKWREAKLKVKT